MNKHVIVALSLVALVGFGCAKPPAPTPEPTTAANSEYQNPQYGFSFAYPSIDDVNVRGDEVRQTKYLGLDVDFFASVRDLVAETKPTNIAYLYATKNLTVDAFKKALTASDPTITVKSTEEVTINNLTMTKIVNTTAIDADKTHYLFEGKDGATIIISIFIQQEEAFAPILQSLRSL